MTKLEEAARNYVLEGIDNCVDHSGQCLEQAFEFGARWAIEEFQKHADENMDIESGVAVDCFVAELRTIIAGAR